MNVRGIGREPPRAAGFRSRARAARVLAIATLTLVTAALRSARAQVDLTGDWNVHQVFSILTFQSVWSITQSGDSLVVDRYTGTIDQSTGMFSLMATSAQIFCPPDTFWGTVTPDGDVLTGVAYAYSATPGRCTGFVGRVWASRSPCGDGVTEPGEECDDGNQVNGDGCDANCTISACGNGIAAAGEQCDDANQAAGDSCPPGCSYSAAGVLIRGDRRSPRGGRDACQVEWYVVNPHDRRDRYRLPRNTQVCTDGDPSCDLSGFDIARAPIPDLTAGVCRFQVVVCLNNQDPNLPACVPAGISSVSVESPTPDISPEPTSDVLASDRAALDQALCRLLQPVGLQKDVCNTIPLSAMQQNLCSAPFTIDVPLDGARHRWVRLVTQSTGGDVSGAPRTSSLRLVCKSGG